MKNVITISFLLASLSVYGQTTSTLTYEGGTSVDIGTGADVCATNIIINGTYSGSGTICTGALPVSILSFTHAVQQRNVTLNWITEWELNNSGFDIERAAVTRGNINEWSKIAFVKGFGTTNESKIYVLEDKKLVKGTYKYRLKQIDFNGNYEYFDLPADVTVEPPNKFNAGQNYPNPSNPKSKIDYEIPVNGKVKLLVYDITGQQVMELVNETQEAGYYSAEFDGSSLSSGVYFYRITAEGEGRKFIKTIKMVLVK